VTDVPRVGVGDTPNEELVRIVEAYLRDHDMPVIGTCLTIALCNTAIDWWNALAVDDEGRRS
jgi:hypothetical protein